MPGHPTVVLGASAAERLGITRTGLETQVVIVDERFTVIGILEPLPPAPELDDAALVGWPVASELLGFDGHPATVYTRSEESEVEAVGTVLAGTANPEAPNKVQVTRPTAALAAS
ncbi:ABC transporter permease [Streptomyces sp. URMC 129]|uniref:ABC transporter permease n=1 Tax=Streptomyces sp. URMC 129 TaxID=3423407 RepID=UPI003F1AFB51